MYPPEHERARSETGDVLLGGLEALAEGLNAFEQSLQLEPLDSRHTD